MRKLRIPILALVAFVVLPTSAPAVPLFGARTSYPVESAPYFVTTADLNRDGKPDLIAGNGSSAKLSVLLGNGDGTFGARADYATASAPTWVAVGDVNGDGKPDLAAASASASKVSVLLGNGDGTFGLTQDYPTGTWPVSVAIADVDGDGKPDLVTSDFNVNSVSVLLGIGDGSFRPASAFGTGLGPHALAIGDLNGDGKPDLVTANAYASTVSVLIGAGNGAFSVNGTYATASRAYFIVIGDVNGDGTPDLATANDDYYGTGGTVSVLIGAGDGTFAPRTDFTTGVQPTSVAIGDLDGDGKLDLVTANRGYATPGSAVSVLRGAGDGSFGAATSFATGIMPNCVAIGDLNGDGRPDLAVADYGSDSLSVLLNQRPPEGAALSAAFGARADFGVGSDPWSVAVADLNRDGRPDLAVANRGASPARAGTVSVLLGAGSGTYGARTDYPAGLDSRSVAIGDLNRDGKPDLAVTNSASNTVSVLLGAGGGSFGTKTDYAVGSEPLWVAIGDVNGDGKPDLAVANNGSGSTSVLLGVGDGTFANRRNVASGFYSRSVAIGDLNRDGKPDLVVANHGTTLNNVGMVSVFPGLGDGNFGTSADYATAGSPAAVGIADLDRDGKPDLAVANLDANSVSVLLGNGNGTFRPRSDFWSGGMLSWSVAIGDLSDDGKPDLAVAMGGSGAAALPANGNGTFGSATGLSAGAGPQSVAIADLDGDGRPELVTANLGAGSVSVLGANRATILLASSPNPSLLNESVTLTATVSPATATGVVYFMDGETTLGWALSGGGVATLADSQLGVGSHALAAVYGGNATFVPSISTLLDHVVLATTLHSFGTSGTPRHDGIALPLSTDGARFPLARLGLGAVDAAQWRLWHWSPATGGYQEALADTMHLGIGQGYWLITRNPRTLQAIGAAASGTVEIPLQDGPSGAAAWNQLGNPFPHSVATRTIVVRSGTSTVALLDTANHVTERVLHLWNPAQSRFDTTTGLLPSGAAFWLRVLPALPADARLAIAGTTPASAASATPVRSVEDLVEWEIRVDARQGDFVATPLHIGAAAVVDGWNPLAVSLPPGPPGPALRLSLQHPEWGPYAGEYSSQFAPAAAAMHWDFELSAASWPGEVALRFALRDLPPGVRVWLSEPGGTLFEEVSSAAPVSLAALSGSRHLRLTVSGLSLPAPPAGIGVSSYPNPFSDRVGFRFLGAPAGELAVDVFDAAGRRVTRLHRDRSELGENVLTWDARGPDGRAVAPGVYLVRWRAGTTHGGGRLVRLR